MSDRSHRRPALGFFLLGLFIAAVAQAGPDDWRQEWPRTDFSRHAVAYDELVSGGPPRMAFRRSIGRLSFRWPKLAVWHRVSR
jgi:hypothetical protein